MTEVSVSSVVQINLVVTDIQLEFGVTLEEVFMCTCKYQVTSIITSVQTN